MNFEIYSDGSKQLYCNCDDMTALETYFRSLAEIHNTGSATRETSFYGPLETLLNDIGQQLKPRVRCVMQLKHQGAGLPDGGLFAARQFQQSGQLKEPEHPERGVIEVKSTGEEIAAIVQTQQVSNYWQRYGQILITNYRDFVLIGRDLQGQPVMLEAFRLAESEQVFWQQVQHPRQFAAAQEEQFSEYLKRVMLQHAVITSPQDLAWFLASYAKDARARIEKTDLPNLTQVREALEEALRVGFAGDKGDHFFKSTLIQTLFYGIFSAWVLWHRQGERGRFEWKTAVWYMHVPMIQALFSKVATPMNLGRLDLVEVLDWAGNALNRVDREAFFSKFDEGQAVQYFYEPFLHAFDPKLRKELGVWYTPPEIVQYMVARVDQVLREELQIADGLADPNVYILDPCCGTGAYLLEVLRKINETLKANGADALGGSDLKQAAMERIFGFEILTAPFVVAHLQLGLLLQTLGVPLTDEQERVGVFLTNALTGWEPPNDVARERFRQLSLHYPELEKEREAADEVKRDRPILVVLGNPPYNAFAGICQQEEISVDDYKIGLIENWGIRKFNLDDLYIRFFRLAEHCITECLPAKGVVCYISNYSYLSDPSYTVMRSRFLDRFDKLWLDCMNGDSRETGKVTPDGKPDPSVFSTEYNREGIRTGTAIALLVRNEDSTLKFSNNNVIEQSDAHKSVYFRDFWGKNKRADILASLKNTNFQSQYQSANPIPENRFSFRPSSVDPHYLMWPKLTEFCAIAPMNGLMEKRGGALMDMEQDALQERMSAYLDPELSWEKYSALGYGLVEPKAGFSPKVVRCKALLEGTFNGSHLVRYTLRPFDTRWVYYSSVSGIWNRSRPSLWKQCWSGNAFLMTRPAGVASPEGYPFFYTRLLGDNDFLRGHAYYFPLQLMNGARLRTKDQLNLLDMLDGKPETDQPFANLSATARQYLSYLDLPNPDQDQATAQLLWMHTLAIGYATDYLSENADGVRQDWPRIPLPKTRELLIRSANLGQQVATLLDTETVVPGVTSTPLRDDLKTIAAIARVGGGQLNPDTDLALTANWGYAVRNSITMPGKGRMIQRAYANTEMQHDLLGVETCDVYLNDIAYWKNIPLRVWEYTVGGYQVIKKWLSYREKSLLGRDLKPDEIREVTQISRRIAALLLLESDLNANYKMIKASTYDWG